MHVFQASFNSAHPSNFDSGCGLLPTVPLTLNLTSVSSFGGFQVSD